MKFSTISQNEYFSQFLRKLDKSVDFGKILKNFKQHFICFLFTTLLELGTYCFGKTNYYFQNALIIHLNCEKFQMKGFGASIIFEI